MYWNKELETMSPEALSAFQVERLRWTMAQASRSPHYGKLFTEKGIGPEQIRGVEDIQQLPFTTKEDLRVQFPYGLLCVGLGEVIRLHTSSGTTGQATAVIHSRTDIENWADLVSRVRFGCGRRIRHL